jgi:hypothetical protein
MPATHSINFADIGRTHRRKQEAVACRTVGGQVIGEEI